MEVRACDGDAIITTGTKYPGLKIADLMKIKINFIPGKRLNKHNSIVRANNRILDVFYQVTSATTRVSELFHLLWFFKIKRSD